MKTPAGEHASVSNHNAAPGFSENATQNAAGNAARGSAENAAGQQASSESACDPESVNKALEELQDKYDKLNDTYLRTMAEYDNYRKRTIKEKADLIKMGGESVLIHILSVIDDMERGIKASSEATDVNAVKEGMELIYNKFQSFLKQQGVTMIETDGVPFDTDHHEAVATIPAPEQGLKGKVLDCVQKGYNLHDKVIRFAKVVVGE